MNKEIILSELRKNEFKCGADVRTSIAKKIKETMGLPLPNQLNIKDWAPVIDYATEVGGAKHGSEYNYRNAQGGVSTAKVYDLYQIPKEVVNPILVCFSGYMPAAVYTLEVFRSYRVKYGRGISLFVTGQGGNKGLFADVFNRETGLMVKTEAEAYMRAMEEVIGFDWVRKYQRQVTDTDTKGNFGEMYQLAKKKRWDEVTFILCSGQPWYTKRLLAEGMLEFAKPQYADVKVNLVVLDCPLTLDSSTPEGHLSEIMLGYIAASLGPLTKDTTPLTTDSEPDFTKERYLLPGVAEANWEMFKELITCYSNMGWPNYQELLYGVAHEEAVYNIIMADLRARASFTPEMYDRALTEDIKTYMSSVNPNGRDKFFCRKMYLKCGWYDGLRHHTEYSKTSYLDYKTCPENYEGWVRDDDPAEENYF